MPTSVQNHHLSLYTTLFYETQTNINKCPGNRHHHQVSENNRPRLPKVEKTLRELLVVERLRRKHKLLKYCEVSDRVYFIVEGLVSAFHLDEKRWERTDWIMAQSDVIIGVDSFYTREPGEEDIETLEPTIVGSISYAELQMIYKKFIGFNRIGRILNEQHNVRARKRAKELGILDASARYAIFKERYPQFLGFVRR